MSAEGLAKMAAEIVSRASAEATRCEDARALDDLRVRYLGRKGELTRLLRELGALGPDEKRAAGARLNEAKRELETRIEEASARMPAGDARRAGPRRDLTLPGRRPLVGRLHPLTQTARELLDTFRHLGFSVREGPEAELQYYNFEALNTPAWHPSRDEQDTFYLAPGVVLRTHTSPVQIRVMEKEKPPIRIVAPGRCYRRDNPDASHGISFHQVEGLYVDRGVSFADLRGTLAEFARQVFGGGSEVRFRPSYFPFTEPSAEMDVRCVGCRGEGCRLCGQSGWLEIMGCGMVHPSVFRAVGYDAEEYTGFAFGMGIERVTLLRYGIDDIRLLTENDLWFLDQF